VTELDYTAVRPVLARVADLGRDLVLVGGQAVNFWASLYEERVPALAQHGPFASKDIEISARGRHVPL
jgi:hypothetical protein